MNDLILLLDSERYLVVQNAAQAQSFDNIALTQHQVLAVQDAAQVQAFDNVALVQHQALTVQDAAQAQSFDNLALTQHQLLAVQDASQAQAVDTVTLTAYIPTFSLLVNDLFQAQVFEAVELDVNNPMPPLMNQQMSGPATQAAPALVGGNSPKATMFMRRQVFEFPAKDNDEDELMMLLLARVNHEP